MLASTSALTLGVLSLAILRLDVAAGESPEESRLEFADGLLWVQVNILNQPDPFHFVFDTGAGSTVLDIEVARGLGLPLDGAVIVRGTQGRTPARRVSNFRGTVANAQLPERVLALDLGPVSQVCHRRIDGLIGADWLPGRILQLDVASRTIRIGSACKPTSADSTTIRIERRNDSWCVPARLNGGSRHWVRFDTGYDGTLCWWPGSSGMARTARAPSLALSVRGKHSVMAELELDDTPNQWVKTTLLRRQLFPGERGLLGNEFLARFRVTIDVDHNRLALEPSTL